MKGCLAASYPLSERNGEKITLSAFQDGDSLSKGRHTWHREYMPLIVKETKDNTLGICCILKYKN